MSPSALTFFSSCHKAPCRMSILRNGHLAMSNLGIKSSYVKHLGEHSKIMWETGRGGGLFICVLSLSPMSC